jgi:pimeloyl-ACP methyl ester carboxylesterase
VVATEGTGRVELPGGRHLAFDDVGDPDGTSVVYLHGTPDSRLGRPPDAGATTAGVRLVAVDRPGFGESPDAPGASLTSLGADLAHLLDALAVERAILLGWSGGGLAALGAAASDALQGRVAGLGLIGTLPPAEAYDDPVVVAALEPGRRAFAEMASDEPPAALAADIAPYLVPDPLDDEIARAHVLEQASETGRAELASVAGSVGALAAGVRAAVQHGLQGLVGDIERQLERGLDLGRIDVPVRTFHGGRDGLSPS